MLKLSSVCTWKWGLFLKMFRRTRNRCLCPCAHSQCSPVSCAMRWTCWWPAMQPPRIVARRYLGIFQESRSMPSHGFPLGLSVHQFRPFFWNCWPVKWISGSPQELGLEDDYTMHSRWPCWVSALNFGCVLTNNTTRIYCPQSKTQMSHWFDPDGPWWLQLSHLNGLFKLPMVSRHQFILYIPDTLQKHLFTFVYTSTNHHSNMEACFFFHMVPWLKYPHWSQPPQSPSMEYPPSEIVVEYRILEDGFLCILFPMKKWHDWLTIHISHHFSIIESWWHHFPFSTGYDGFSGHFLAPKGDESTVERAAAWAAAEESLKSLKREDRDSAPHKRAVMWPWEFNDQTWRVQNGVP